MSEDLLAEWCESERKLKELSNMHETYRIRAEARIRELEASLKASTEVLRDEINRNRNLPADLIDAQRRLDEKDECIRELEVAVGVEGEMPKEADRSSGNFGTLIRKLAEKIKERDRRLRETRGERDTALKRAEAANDQGVKWMRRCQEAEAAVAAKSPTLDWLLDRAANVLKDAGWYSPEEFAQANAAAAAMRKAIERYVRNAELPIPTAVWEVRIRELEAALASDAGKPLLDELERLRSELLGVSKLKEKALEVSAQLNGENERLRTEMNKLKEMFVSRCEASDRIGQRCYDAEEELRVLRKRLEAAEAMMEGELLCRHGCIDSMPLTEDAFEKWAGKKLFPK